MKIQKILLPALVALVLAGCSEPQVDSTTDDSMKSSIEKVRMALPQEKRADFDRAIKVLAFSQIDMKSLFVDGASGVSTSKEKMKDILNGKTGVQILAEADRIIKERKEKERTQALNEIEELKEKQANAELAKKELSKFKVLRSRFTKQEQRYGRAKPIIELTVQNGTNKSVSRAYFKGTLASPGRSVPWLQEAFNYEISGGLEPNEKADWSLAPNMFSDWGRVDAPEDAILTVEVEQIDGADKKPLFSSKTFTEIDLKRLTQLQEKYAQ